MRSTILGISLLCVLPFASAHGYLRSITIDGKTFEGNVPNANPSDSPIRQINSVEPVKGATNSDISCGQGAEKAALVVDANPGSTLAFDWSNGEGGIWPHNTGPMLTYLASCGDTKCDNFDSSSAKWFKIDEAGLTDGTWAQAALMEGKSYSLNLPSNLASGQYLVRHEIIALQLAVSEGGAEFYPSCSQINVGGNENGTPSGELVSFPGAYSDNDPGILVDAFSITNYEFPGPSVANPSGNGGSGNDSPNDSSSNSASSTTSSSTSSTTSSSPSKSPNASESAGSSSSSSAGANATRTRAAAGSATPAAEDSSGTSAAEGSPATPAADGSSFTTAAESASTNPSSERRHHDNHSCGDESSAKTSAAAGSESTFSFTVTSTLSLGDIPTPTQSDVENISSIPTSETRPQRMSRVMRSLQERL